jgi:hypothetical protein
MARGFTNQLGPRPRFDGAVLRRVLPALEDRDDFSESLVEAGRSPGESLVGAAIVVESDPDAGQFAQRWSDVFEFRRDGAQWGLVALDQGVERDTLRGQLASAINASPLLFAVGPASSGGPSVTPTTTVPPEDNGSGNEPPPGDEPEPPEDPIPPVPLPTIPPIPGEPDPEAPEDPNGSDPEPPDDADDLIGGLLDSLLP